MLGADERKKHSSLSFLTSTDISLCPKARAARMLPTRQKEAQALRRLSLHQRDFCPQVPTIVQPFLKLTADESQVWFGLKEPLY